MSQSHLTHLIKFHLACIPLCDWPADLLVLNFDFISWSPESELCSLPTDLFLLELALAAKFYPAYELESVLLPPSLSTRSLTRFSKSSLLIFFFELSPSIFLYILRFSCLCCVCYWYCFRLTSRPYLRFLTEIDCSLAMSNLAKLCSKISV